MQYYGDSGRSLKATPFDIMNWQRMIMHKPDGKGSKSYASRDVPASDVDDANRDPIYVAAKRQRLNVSGDSIITKQLIIAARKVHFKRNVGAWDALQTNIASQFKDVFHEGVEIGGRRQYLAVVAAKGDLEWSHRLVTLISFSSLKGPVNSVLPYTLYILSI